MLLFPHTPALRSPLGSSSALSVASLPVPFRGAVIFPFSTLEIFFSSLECRCILSICYALHSAHEVWLLPSVSHSNQPCLLLSPVLETQPALLLRYSLDSSSAFGAFHSVALTTPSKPVSMPNPEPLLGFFLHPLNRDCIVVWFAYFHLLSFACVISLSRDALSVSLFVFKLSFKFSLAVHASIHPSLQWMDLPFTKYLLRSQTFSLPPTKKKAQNARN